MIPDSRLIDFSNRPANGFWDKNTAPSDLFAYYRSKFKELATVTGHALEKTREIPPEEKQVILQNFDRFQEALEGGEPIWRYRQDKPAEFSLHIAFRPNMVVAKVQTYEIGDERTSGGIACYEDSALSRDMSALIGKISKIKKIVCRSLDSPGPASSQRIGIYCFRKTVSEFIGDFFFSQGKILENLEGTVQLIREHGVVLSEYHST